VAGETRIRGVDAVALKIEDYALIGDCHSAALVGRDGSIDWLCLPRFDSGACFAALLGEPAHGRWLIAPIEDVRRVQRRYRDGTLILETDCETAHGAVRIIDFMSLAEGRRDLVRIVEGLRGRVIMRTELVVRFDYGSIVPWVRRTDGTLRATGGPDTLELHTPVPTHGERMTTVGEFTVEAGDRVPFLLNYRASHEAVQPAIDAEQLLRDSQRDWTSWSKSCAYQGPWKSQVLRSLITLKALTYAPTGGLVAAPTTSLPEQIGGSRNWDYRYCWLRDSTLTLGALLLAGYKDEAAAWREWLLRAVAGRPADLQIMYSVTGERRLAESVLDWLPGYRESRPVRVGNGAAGQLQIDVFGEVMDTLHLARTAGLAPEPHAWQIQIALLDLLESQWREPDQGIWEIRGPARHFTHSKVMAWVAFDRAVKAVERFGLEGPVEVWRRERHAIHAQVCDAGFDASRACFVQRYGAPDLDASLLMIPLVGFLPPDDPRVRATVEAIERELMIGGLVRRYSTDSRVDGMESGEGAFLPCTFWLVECLALTGRRDDAVALFERLLALCNDVGLLSEEFDSRERVMTGNYPQALSHMALVNTAWVLSLPVPWVERASREGERLVAVAHAS